MPDPVHGKHIPVSITVGGRNELTIPNGTARKIMFNNGHNEPIYIAFGAKGVAADEDDIRLDFGYTELMIPDDATSVAFWAAVDCSVVAAFAFMGKPLRDPLPDLGLPGMPGLIQPAPIEPPAADEAAVDEEDKRAIAPRLRKR